MEMRKWPDRDEIEAIIRVAKEERQREIARITRWSAQALRALFTRGAAMPRVKLPRAA